MFTIGEGRFVDLFDNGVGAFRRTTGAASASSSPPPRPTGLVSAGVTASTPEPSTWAMMILGFAGLGFAGYRASRKAAAIAA